jgi:Holliday junction resolvase RusA-like endonuclease
MINQRLDIKPLSVNEAWQGKRFKTNKYKSYQRLMLLNLKKSNQDLSGMLRIELFFGFSSSASDIDNPVKMILDILQKKYSFDDKQVFELNIRKCIVTKESEFIEFNIEKLLPF